MGRYTPIRITKNDIAEYQRLVRNSKAKIRRTNKNYGIDLTSEIELPSMESFKTRNEFNKWKGEVKKFTNRANANYQFKKNEYGVVASVKEINEIKKNTKKAQKIAEKLQKEVANKPFISGGKEQSTIGQQMMMMGKPNTGGIYRPPDFNFDKIRSRKHLEEKKENIEERADPRFIDKRSEKLKNTYMQMVSQAYNSDADELISELEKISATDFYELFLMHEELQFDYEYTEEQSEANLAKKMAIIERYKSGKINMDLRGF